MSIFDCNADWQIFFSGPTGWQIFPLGRPAGSRGQSHKDFGVARRMSLCIVCPRCALSIAQTYLQGRPSVHNLVRRFSSTPFLTANSSTIPPALAGIPSSKSIQSFLRSFESTNTSFLSDHTVSSAFIQKVDPEITSFLKAVAAGNDNEWWDQYIDLFLNKGLSRLSRVHFTQILRALHPTKFHPSTGSVDSKEFFHRLDRVKCDMQAHGYRLGLTEWNHLLDCARASSSPEKAEGYWNEMLQSHVQPDTFSYNNLLTALCGKASRLQYERPVRYELGEDGQLIDLGKTQSYSARTYQRFPSTGKSVLARDIVQAMVAKSIRPNAYTYEILIIAFARDNDMDTVNEIIRRIWGFNPDGTPCESSVSLPAGSSLWPSEHTLIAIANGYGYNGDLSSAIALIEAFSARYSIRVGVSVWLALLLWSSRRSTIHQSPCFGTLSPLAAPRLFQVMKSPPYNVNPGIEMYWHMINHEKRRGAALSAERLLVEALKRYGPNGTDLTPDTQHLAWRTLSGAKNWVPILCDSLAANSQRGEAMGMFRRWQHRFHALETTGLLRIWDEVDEDRKTDVPGVILPPSSGKASEGPTSLSIRRRLARASARERRIAYRRIARRRREHYPYRWRGPGRPLFLPAGINIQFGLGSPSPRYRKSHKLWQRHVRASFGPPRQDQEDKRSVRSKRRQPKREKMFAKSKRWKRRDPMYREWEERSRILNVDKDLWKKRKMPDSRKRTSKMLTPLDVTFEYVSNSRVAKVTDNTDLDALLTDEIKDGLLGKGPKTRSGWLKTAVEKLKPFLRHIL